MNQQTAAGLGPKVGLAEGFDGAKPIVGGVDGPDVDAIDVLAAAYGARRDVQAVIDAIIKRTSATSIHRGSNEWGAFFQVVGILVQDPSNIGTLKKGRPLPRPYREAMTQMVAVYVPSIPADSFVEKVLADIASVLQGVHTVTTPSISLPKSNDGPGRVRQILAAGGVVALLRGAAKRAEQDPNPQIAWSNDRIRTLAALAMELAADSHEDEGAVTKLRVAAKRRGRDLTRAAALIRSEGTTNEDRIRHRANRLLIAAVTGSGVQSPTADEVRRFERIDELKAIPLPGAYARLTEMISALAELKERIAADAAAAAARNGGTLDEDNEERLWGEILDGLQSLLGPEAHTSDELLGSETAFEVARLHLADSAGLRISD